jgi:hypothetical protein
MALVLLSQGSLTKEAAIRPLLYSTIRENCWENTLFFVSLTRAERKDVTEKQHINTLRD